LFRPEGARATDARYMLRHVIVGVGERKGDGNLIRYHAVL
jgi:hypothetical protein